MLGVALAINYQRLQVRTNPEISQSPVLRRFKRNVAMRKFLPIAYLLTLLAGCATSTQVGNTARSSIEQRLLTSSFEQALATLDTHEFKGKTVTVDFYGLTSDRDFAKEFFTAWLEEQQVQIATDPKQAQLHLKVFAPVLAVDQGQSFVGAPAFTVPILGFVIPEIALFKNARHSGHTEVEVFTIDGGTGKFVDRSPPAIGETNYNDYTVLIVIHFTRSEMETRKWDWQPGS
jgi:hypothetical protein